jgi:hypothetical protein
MTALSHLPTGRQVQPLKIPPTQPFPSREESEGAAVQSRHNDAKVTTGTVAPDGGGE